MSVWAMLLVTPSGRPAPAESARRTRAVIDGWDSWLLPIARSGELLSASRGHTLGLLFMVTGDDTEGELRLQSRHSYSCSPIERVDGAAGWRFSPSTLDVIERFIKESGPRGVRRAKVADALTSTFGSQLHAVHRLLHSLRLSRSDAFAVEDYLAGHTIDDPELPDVFRSDPRGSGVRAIALDHGAAGWHRLVASQDLYDYGEPPCLVRADVGGLFVASDPPVALRFFDDKDLAHQVGAGDWVEVPAASAGSVAEFIAWARENVGVAGRAVSTPRRPLRGEVDDEPPGLHETRFPGWRHRLAEHATLEISLSQRAPFPEFATAVPALLHTVRQELLLPLMAAYRSAGGDAVAASHGTFGEPHQMLASAVTPAARGDDHTYAIDTDEWHQAVNAVANRRRALTCTVEVCDATGFASGLRWGRTQIVITPGKPPSVATLTITIAEPHLALLGDITPVTALIRHAITSAGLSAGGASIGRTTRRPHWLTLLDRTQLGAVGGLDQLVHSGLLHSVHTLESPTGEITWLQATPHPSQYDQTHASRLTHMVGVAWNR